MRKIIHIDMDCFYAAIEMRERPELAGKPVAVGGASERGVLTTCNYEARKFGCRSAMPGYMAKRLCPSLILLPVRFDLYRAESRTIRKILLSYTPLVEPLSLDEAYLDVTALPRYAWDIAKEIRARIFETIKLTASAGIAPNKMLAKIASDWRKPDGQFAITPEDIDEFMKALPVRKIWGIGPKSADRLEKRGIDTCGKLQELSMTDLLVMFGKFGDELYHLCRGEDDRPVEPHRPRKSLSNERTFSHNLESLEDCQRELEKQFRELREDLDSKAADRKIAKLFVKLKFADFRRTTKECLCEEPTLDTCRDLLREAFARSSQSVRLLGVGVRFREENESTPAPAQLDLPFENKGPRQRAGPH